MATYAIKVTESLTRTVLVEADSLDEANELVEEAHEDGKIVLDYDDYDGREIGASPYWSGGVFTGTEKERSLYEEI